jgi:hypothetical protein
MNKLIKPKKCEVCGQPIWNPEWWDNDCGQMCGVCTLGESAELFPEGIRIAPNIKDVDTDKKFLIYWNKWYQNTYLKCPK